MELSYDWKSFQSFFYSKKKLKSSALKSPLWIVVDGTRVVCALSEGESLPQCTGVALDTVRADFPEHELILFDRSQVDASLSRALDAPHFFSQLDSLRKQAMEVPKGSGFSRSHLHLAPGNFLLQAMQSWWLKLFPTHFGVYLQLDRNAATSLLLFFHRGKLESFHVPDLSSMIPDRRKVSADITKYLSEKYLLPIQGVYLTSKEWQTWSEMDQPWSAVARAIRMDHSKLAPFRWDLLSLIALRGVFRI